MSTRQATEVHAPPIQSSLPLKKLTVVLDLDETLVSTTMSYDLSDDVKTKAIEAGLNWFEFECESDCNEGMDSYTTFERPGLQEFLKQVKEFAVLVLFTAAEEDYARKVVDQIDKEKRFDLCLFRQSITISKFKNRAKDISRISKDLSRIVIVDDRHFNFRMQPSNGIPCVPFSLNAPDDNQLLEVVLPLLKKLSREEDVRPLLDQKFQCRKWFEEHGISGFF